jgi:hypothetical protein
MGSPYPSIRISECDHEKDQLKPRKFVADAAEISGVGWESCQRELSLHNVA